jgi:hypothetical protein
MTLVSSNLRELVILRIWDEDVRRISTQANQTNHSFTSNGEPIS